jgi:hypothetical protein
MVNTNLLSSQGLSQCMVASLPEGNSEPLKNAYDAIALAAHACMLSIGARLVGLGEDHRIEAQSDAGQTQPLPTEWNSHSGSYAFRYKHGQSSMEFLLKVNRMGNKVVVMGMGMGDDKTYSFDVRTQDYISESSLPLRLSDTTSSNEEDPSPTASKEAAEKKVIDIFISIGRLSDFGTLMRLSIFQKLLPSIQKEGYEESSTSSTTNPPANARQPRREDYDPSRYSPLRDDPPPARPHPHHDDPLVLPNRGGRPLPEPIPGFEDEFEIQRPGGRGGLPGIGGGGGFGRIGERDLYPQGLGPNDPFRGSGGGGFGPGGVGGGGGMHPTFDDPLFAGGRPGGGPGGQQYDPRAPPGSRFDPVGPGMGGGPLGGGGHPRGAGMGGRPPHNPFGGFGDGDFI